MGLTVEAVTAVSVTVSWSPATPDAGVDHYVVSVDGTLRAESGRATGRAAVANLAPATTYTVAVRAVDETGTASPPATVEATTAAVDGTADDSRSLPMRPDPNDATDEHT